MIMKKLLTLLWLFAAVALSAQNNAKGIVKEEEDQHPIEGATVYIPELKVGTATDEMGRFEIDNIPNGNFLVEISSLGFAKKVLSLNTSDGTEIEVLLSHSATEMQEVVVSGVSASTERLRNPVATLPIRREMLLQNASTNIIDGIAKFPGINQIATGPAISKPVIRGLGYNRVVVLRNGMRQEGQQWGDEHGIEMDEMEVDRVEIVKGPGSVMYGSDAMAGVVNFLTPRPVAEGTLLGEVVADYQSNSNLLATSVMQAGNVGGFSWLGRFSQKKSGNFRNPADGYVLNSGFQELNGSGYLGYAGTWGYSQIHISTFNQKIGIVEGERDSLGRFIGPVVENDSTVGEMSYLNEDLSGFQNAIGVPFQRIGHNRVTWNSKLYFGGSKLSVDLGWQQNRRREFGNALAPDETELHFLLNTFNGNVIYHFPDKKSWKISTGLSAQYQTSRNFGEEYLIPAYDMTDLGAFVFVQKEQGKWFFSGGLRFDYRNVSSKSLYLNADEEEVGPNDPGAEEKFAAFGRHFSNVTGALGVSYQITPDLIARANVSKGFRAPNLSELGSNGKHEGTFRYEVGNANLKSENSYQGDLGLTLNRQHFTFELDGFFNNIQNYVFLEKLTGSSGGDSIVDVDDPAPLFKFVQGDARLFGGEFSMDFHPHPLDWLHFENAFSFVRGIQANQPDSSRNLPLMPAPRYQLTIKAQLQQPFRCFQSSYFLLEGNYFFAQNEVYSAFGTETPTPGYFLLNAGFGSDFVNKKGKTIFRLFVTANNLLGETYQSHLSRLKYGPENLANGRTGVFNPGRNFSVKMVLPIGG